MKDIASHDDTCTELLETASYKTHTLVEIIYESACPPKGWEEFFNREDVKKMMQGISDRLINDSRIQGFGLNPKIGWIFRAFNMVPPDKVKAIIMGQDPAPQPGLATGLSFSLDPSVHPRLVQSVLRVILEARNEGYCVNATQGVLIKWARQGVLLLNTALTLVEKKIGSHIKLWREFSREMMKFINEKTNPSVWILWGSKAKVLKSKIDKNKHYIVEGGHPSPRAPAEKFFCQNYFSCANEWLCKKGRGMIDWNLVPLPCRKHTSRLFGWKKSEPGFYNKDECEMQPCPAF